MCDGGGRGHDRRYKLRLFVDPTALKPQKAEDAFELSGSYAYLGRIYFELPDGIEFGNFNLAVKFASSIVKVPMEIMDTERQNEFEKELKAAKKEARKKN